MIFFVLWSNSKPIFLHAFRRFCLIGCAKRQNKILLLNLFVRKSLDSSSSNQFRQNKTAFCLNSYYTKVAISLNERCKLYCSHACKPTVLFVYIRCPFDFFLSKVSGTEEVQLSYGARKFLDLCSGTLFGSILKQNLNAQARS